MKVKPMLGSFALDNIVHIESSESRALVEHHIPGLAGSYFQDMGTVPNTILIIGTKYGDEARDDFLKGIREIFNKGDPTTFVADINTATDITDVLIEDLDVAEVGGSPDTFRYKIKIRKYIKPPEPTLTGLLDAGILEDATKVADTAMNVIDTLGSSPDFGNPSGPLSNAIGGVRTATDGIDAISEDLKSLISPETEMSSTRGAGETPAEGTAESPPSGGAEEVIPAEGSTEAPSAEGASEKTSTEGPEETTPEDEFLMGPVDIPPEAWDALESLRQTLGETADEYDFGIGFKRTAGKFLNELALIIYVPEKKPSEEIPSSKKIPSESKGFPTDVVENHITLLSDTERYDTLRGGIEISPRLTVINGVGYPEAGTLGVVVRRLSNGKKLFLTCEHVASHGIPDPNNPNGEKINVHDAVGQEIFQPMDNPNSPEPKPSVIGICIASSTDLDAAIIDPELSNPKDPIPPKRAISSEIKEIGPVMGKNTIKELGEHVRKRGKTTGLTTGWICALRGIHDKDQANEFEISPWEYYGKYSDFCDHGDSGSAVLNYQNEVVGLLQSVRCLSSGGYAYYCPTAFATRIDPILEALGKEINDKIDIAVDPVIYSITPNYWDPSLGPVVIEGFGFESPNQVYFGDALAQVLLETPTHLEVIPPQGPDASVFDVRVCNKWQDFSEPGPESMFEYKTVHQGTTPTATPRVLTYTTADVIDERISVPAQHSLVRLSKNPDTSADAVGMLEEVKADRLAAIYCVNWEKSAKRAIKLGTTWWEAIADGEDAVLMLDPDDLNAGAPILSFRRGLDPDCGGNETSASPSRIDAALIKVWNTYLRWRKGELQAPCPSSRIDEESASSNFQESGNVPTNDPCNTDLTILPPGCESVGPKKLFIFEVGNNDRRTVDKWILNIVDRNGNPCNHNGELMGNDITVTETAILKAAEFMAYDIVRDLKKYFAIITSPRNDIQRKRIEIILNDANPQIKQEMDRIRAIISNQTEINNWIAARERILKMAGTTLILSTRSSKSKYIPLVGAEFEGIMFRNYLINPFTWYASSIPPTETTFSSAERARIAFSPIALILHESDHDMDCIFRTGIMGGDCAAAGIITPNDPAENATIKDIDKALGAHPHIAKRFAHIGGFSERCDFPNFKDEVDHGLRVFLDMNPPTSVAALETNRPTDPSLVWIELPSDSTLRSGIKKV